MKDVFDSNETMNTAYVVKTEDDAMELLEILRGMGLLWSGSGYGIFDSSKNIDYIKAQINRGRCICIGVDKRGSNRRRVSCGGIQAYSSEGYKIVDAEEIFAKEDINHEDISTLF